jgi:hypothetical protein
MMAWQPDEPVRRHETEAIPPPPPGLANATSLEDDMIDAFSRQLAAGR